MPAKERERGIAANTNRQFGADNVLLIVRAGDEPASEVASFYQKERRLKGMNLLEVTTDITDVASAATRAQCLELISQIQWRMEQVDHPIKVLLFVGEWPLRVSDQAWGFERQLGFFDAFHRMEYFKTAPTAYVYTNNLDKFWNSLGTNVPEATPWELNRPNSSPSLDPYVNGQILDDGYVTVFNIPVTRIENGVEIAKQRISEGIQVEKMGRPGLGTILLSGGSNTNPVSRFVLAEAQYEELPISNIFWTGFTQNSGEVVPGVPYFDEVPINNDPHGYISYRPGQEGFVGASNIGLISPGQRSYYGTRGNRPELPGEYGYQLGAIGIFSQSYGIRPHPNYIVEMWKELPPVAVERQEIPQGGSVDILFPNVRGTTSRTFYVSNLSETGTMEIEVTSTDLTVYLDSDEEYSLSFEGLTVNDIWYEIFNNKTSNFGVSLVQSDGTGAMSAALAAFRAGCAITAGVSIEPLTDGDLDTFGLYTSLLCGCSVAEWAFRRYSYVLTPIAPTGVSPRGWVFYGDPLYRPFGHLVSQEGGPSIHFLYQVEGQNGL